MAVAELWLQIQYIITVPIKLSRILSLVLAIPLLDGMKRQMELELLGIKTLRAHMKMELLGLGLIQRILLYMPNGQLIHMI